MKGRSVTFTDSPPEVIETSNNSHNICPPLPIRNIFLWLQLAKIEGKQRRYASKTEHQWQQHHHSRSISDLNKQQHDLSEESKAGKLHFNNNKGKNLFQQKRMESLYQSIPDLGTALRTRPPLKAAIESVRNVTKIDTSFNLYDLCRKGQEKKLLESSVVKDNVDHFNDNSSDIDDFNNNDKTAGRRGIIYQYRNSVNDGIHRNKNFIHGASISTVNYNYGCTNNNINDSNVNKNVENIIKGNAKANKSNNNCGKLTERSLQRYHYHHLNDYRKSDFVAKNWFWKNGSGYDDNGISYLVPSHCYSSLNKPLQQKNCYRRYYSNDAKNTSFFFATTTGNNNSMRNIISKHRWYYPFMMYSEMQQKQPMDGN